ncbi:MAG TPA: ribosome recycling factor [Candidatus Faecousia excrementigallinarum]|uniref:Ribosome-recycling factor n=1 Tax=Candidatus Faecousia excrementigallinarum TaxID=2840806 RepID=A0A9D0Z222_9FIRM|nr:ribosome recycling factor [Candidatus Faecousia excrementigallinarum]
MSVDFKEYERKMSRTLDVLAENFGAVRAGRANAKVLDRITVEYYGQETALSGVATISSPDARTLVIQPWDGTLLKAIQKAILTSDLGINPQNDGRVIRLVFPQLTEERRKELTKQVKKYAEDAKVAMRNIRRDGMDYVKALKKKSEITEDEQKKAEKDLQDMLDKHIKKADEALAAKEKELMAI